MKMLRGKSTKEMKRAVLVYLYTIKRQHNTIKLNWYLIIDPRRHVPSAKRSDLTREKIMDGWMDRKR